MSLDRVNLIWCPSVFEERPADAFLVMCAFCSMPVWARPSTVTMIVQDGVLPMCGAHPDVILAGTLAVHPAQGPEAFALARSLGFVDMTHPQATRRARYRPRDPRRARTN